MNLAVANMADASDQRCVVSVAPLLPGLFWIGWDRRKQSWHDKLAHTVVIREDDALLSLEELARGTS